MRTNSSAREHLLWAVTISLVFSASIVLALAARVEDVNEISVSAAIPGWHHYPLALLETAGPPPPQYVLSLRPASLPTFLVHPEIRVPFETNNRTVDVIEGALEVLGTNCAFVTSRTEMSSRSRLRFLRNDTCRSLRGTPTGDVKLVIRLMRRHRISVRTLVPVAPEADQSGITVHVIGTPGAVGPFPVLEAYYVDHLSETSTRRIDLLAYLWQISAAPTWIWQLVAVACLLWLVASIVTANTEATELGNRLRYGVRAALGTGCAAAALGLSYAVLVPPLQAPDEPSHLLSYALLTRGSLDGVDAPNSAETIQWASVGHLGRIRFEPEERFRPINIGSPLPPARRYIWFEDTTARSATGAIWWRLLSSHIGQRSMPKTLLIVRLANALLFACIAGVSALLLSYASDNRVPYPQLLSSFILIVPTLPFFAMHFSELGPCIAMYVLLASSILILFLDTRRSSWAGFPMGLSLSLLIIGGRSSLPMLPVIACVLLARSVLGCRGTRTSWEQTTSAAVFWIGFALGSSTFLLVDHSAFFSQVQTTLLGVHGRFAELIGPLLKPEVMLAAAPAGFLAELIIARLRALHRVQQFAAGPFAGFGRRICYLGALLVLGSLVASLLMDYPHVADLDGPNDLARFEYVRSVIYTVASSFRLVGADHYMFTSFWLGFGWLDTIPRAGLPAVIAAGTGLLLAALLVHLGRSEDVRRTTWLAIVGVGWWATLAAYAIATYQMQRNLHGRYLIGIYLIGAAIIFSPLGLANAAGFWKRLPITRPAATLLFSSALHAYCLWFILNRYF